jgi:Na+/H+-dicarboxylate symporter
MGNMETLGEIGSKTIRVILLHMTIIGAFMTAFGSLFYHIEKGNGSVSSFSQIFDLIYNIIPSNLFEPFVTGNALQLIFISVIVGLAMLVLSSKVSGVFSLVEQLSSIVQTMMSGLCSMLPILIFVIFAGMISNGNLAIILRSWKLIVVIVLMMVVYYVLNLLRISLVKKISPALLFKKTWPTFLIALTTASSAAAFATNTRDANNKLGIDKKLVEFGIPIGQVLYKPGFFALLFGIGIGLAESCNIPITLSWLLIFFLTILLVNFAVPPIPGGAMLGFTIAFAQIGIPMEAMGVAIAINAIVDFPATVSNVSGWQLTLIDVADSLNMIDQKVLHKEETNTNGIKH